MTNLELIRSMSKDEVASLLHLICESEARDYMDWSSWLDQNNPELVPIGTMVLADILVKTSTGFTVDRKTVPCVILDDDIKLCGTKYVRIYELDKKRISVIPSSHLDMTYV